MTPISRLDDPDQRHAWPAGLDAYAINGRIWHRQLSGIAHPSADIQPMA